MMRQMLEDNALTRCFRCSNDMFGKQYQAACFLMLKIHDRMISWILWFTFPLLLQLLIYLHQTT